MLMKVFNKGQVVLPVAVRRELGIEVGDLVEVNVDSEHKGVYIQRQSEGGIVKEMGGALHAYAAAKKFPSDMEISAAMRKGMADEGTPS